MDQVFPLKIADTTPERWHEYFTPVEASRQPLSSIYKNEPRIHSSAGVLSLTSNTDERVGWHVGMLNGGDGILFTI
ncbi:MAG: hypothetical protein KDA81_10790 [Planctomycetaceae bacterium]|nr:hypothetical protein [Planctomycetaceae bacterium]